MQLRDRIMLRRRELGLTQAQVASKLGVAQNTVSDYERGRCDMPTRTLERLLEVLGLKMTVEIVEVTEVSHAE